MEFKPLAHIKPEILQFKQAKNGNYSVCRIELNLIIKNETKNNKIKLVYGFVHSNEKQVEFKNISGN